MAFKTHIHAHLRDDLFAFTDAEIFVDTNKLNNCDFIIYGLTHLRKDYSYNNFYIKYEENRDKLINLNYLPIIPGIKPSTFTQIFKKQVDARISIYQNHLHQTVIQAYTGYTISYKIFININTSYKNKPACILEYLIKYNYISEFQYTELYECINLFYVNCEAIMNKINEGILALGNKMDDHAIISKHYDISSYQYLYGFLKIPYTMYN